MTENSSWYIIQQPSGHCELAQSEAVAANSDREVATEKQTSLESWGPFDTKNQAIAKRVGLIRAGKCKPN